MKIENRIKRLFTAFLVVFGVMFLSTVKAEAAMTKSCTFVVTNMGDNSSLVIRVYNDLADEYYRDYEWKENSGTKSIYCGGSITVTYNAAGKSYTVTYNDVVIENYTPWIYCNAGTKANYTAMRFKTEEGSATGNRNEVGVIVDNQDTERDANGYISRYTGKGFKGVGATLTAEWQPNTYTITLNNRSATTPGTTAYYEKYATANYKDRGCTGVITSINKPTKKGYTFGGYYTGTDGSGTQYVDSNGVVRSSSTTFTKDTTLYAKWTANSYTLCTGQHF